MASTLVGKGDGDPHGPALLEWKEREQSYCVGPVRRMIVASSHKTRREMGILFFWACRERVVAMTLNREGDMGSLACWIC